MKWSKIWPDGYDAFYDTPQCREENAEIAKGLNIVVHAGDRMIDFGCGTGLSLTLLNGKRDVVVWRGVDHDPEFVGHGNEEDAARVAKRAVYDVGVMLFSAEEIGIEGVKAMLDRAKRFMIVWYHQPYKDEGSWFYRKPIRFYLGYWLKSRRIYRELAKKGAYIAPLCGQQGYWIAIGV